MLPTFSQKLLILQEAFKTQINEELQRTESDSKLSPFFSLNVEN